MLIKRIYEIDPMVCSQCGGEMEIISFIDPPQNAVIEKILRGHRRAALVDGLWKASSPRGPPDSVGSVHDLNYESMDQTPELTLIWIRSRLPFKSPMHVGTGPVRTSRSI